MIRVITVVRLVRFIRVVRVINNYRAIYACCNDIDPVLTNLDPVPALPSTNKLIARLPRNLRIVRASMLLKLLHG